MPKILVCTGYKRSGSGNIISYNCLRLNQADYQNFMSGKAYQGAMPMDHTPAEIKKLVSSGECILDSNMKITPGGRLEVKPTKWMGNPRYTEIAKEMLNKLISDLGITYKGCYVRQMFDITSKGYVLMTSGVQLSGVQSKYMPDFKSLQITVDWDGSSKANGLMLIIVFGRVSDLIRDGLVELQTVGDYTTVLPNTVDNMTVAKAAEYLCNMTVQHIKTTKRGPGYNYTEKHEIKFRG